MMRLVEITTTIQVESDCTTEEAVREAVESLLWGLKEGSVEALVSPAHGLDSAYEYLPKPAELTWRFEGENTA